MNFKDITRRINPRFLYLAVLVAMTFFLTGFAAAEEATNDYHDVNYDEGFEVEYKPKYEPKADTTTVSARVGEVEKDYKLHSETTGKATVRAQNEDGTYVEASVSQSDEETKAEVRVGGQF